MHLFDEICIVLGCLFIGTLGVSSNCPEGFEELDDDCIYFSHDVEVRFFYDTNKYQLIPLKCR